MSDGSGIAPLFEFVVGEDRRLHDVVTETEAAPLLRMAMLGGAIMATVTDESGNFLWRESTGEETSGTIAKRPIRLEGETAGWALVGAIKQAEPLADALAAAIEGLAAGNLKRMLTTETHTAVVNRSYNELLETNRKLLASEQRYRELSEMLEVKVADRTADLERAWTRLLQQEKLASVGQLAAGIAHEINNPMSFITSNINTLSRYVARFSSLLAFQRAAIDRCASEEARQEARQRWESGRIDFMLGDIEALFGQTLAGAERVRKIVSDLRGFSHIDDDGAQVADLNAEIERTLSVMGHEIPPDALIEKDFAPLPGFRCNPAHFCQLFLGIIRNAVQARPAGLVLGIRSRAEGDRITIAFSDNGPGIPAGLIPHVFEPFFTTRTIGHGVGLGLTVAHEVVTAHGGTIEASNRPSEGALFTITLQIGKG